MYKIILKNNEGSYPLIWGRKETIFNAFGRVLNIDKNLLCTFNIDEEQESRIESIRLSKIKNFFKKS